MTFDSCLRHALFVTLSSLVLQGTLANAADEPPPVLSPEVMPDHRVIFRLELPVGEHVKIIGIKRIPIEMKRDATGIWTATVGPLLPGLYEYSFNIDGEETADPANPKVKLDRSPNSSLLEVWSDEPLFYQWKNIPHGTVRLHDYFSRPLKRLRGLRVYTPPGYEKDPKAHFPVLYLFHGTGDTEATWTDFGRAQYIIDNLIAAGKANPMIIVMPDGHADLHEEEGIHPANFIKFEADLLQSAMPYVEKNYRTIANADNRAICGLSMGGMQSLYIGLEHPDMFAWVGGMSAYVPEAEKMCAKAFNDPMLNSKLRLLWHSIGKDDFLFKGYAEFDSLLDKHHINRQFRVTEGIHEWHVWRQYLADFAPLLFMPKVEAGK